MEGLTDETFKNDNTVLVYFTAVWCGPCRHQGPIMEEVANEINMKVVKYDVDKAVDMANELGIRSIPTIAVLKNGKIAESLVGLSKKTDILEMVNRHA